MGEVRRSDYTYEQKQVYETTVREFLMPLHSHAILDSQHAIEQVLAYQRQNGNNQDFRTGAALAAVKHPQGRPIASKVSEFDPEDKEYVQTLLCLSIQLEFTGEADYSLVGASLSSQKDTYQFLCRVGSFSDEVIILEHFLRGQRRVYIYIYICISSVLFLSMQLEKYYYYY